MNSDHVLEKLTPDATIRQIVSAENKAENLLSSIGLIPKNHENETLRSVCQQKKWSETEVLEWIKKHCSDANDSNTGLENRGIPGRDSSLEELTGYLENTFIHPNLILLKELKEIFPRVHKIHGNQYPSLKYTEWHFSTFHEVLTFFYEFERETFFPLVNRLPGVQKGKVNHGTVKKLQKSFDILEKDHIRLKELMTTISEKANHFQNPSLACTTLRIQNDTFKNLFQQLQEQFQYERKHVIPRVKDKIEAKV